MRNNYYVYFFECPVGADSRASPAAASAASADPGAARVVCAAQCDGTPAPHESFHGVAPQAAVHG